MSTPMIPENWPKLLEPGLRYLFQSRLENRERLGKRQMIYGAATSTRSFEEAMGVGALSDQDWNFEDTRRVQYDGVKPGFVTRWTHREFAKGMTIERKLLDDNLYPGAQLPRDITGQPVQLADAAFILREKSAAEVFNGATTASGVSPTGFAYAGADGKALLANDHPIGPGSSTTQDNLFALALDATNYDTVRLAMREFTDDQGNIVLVQPDTLIVPPELETAALVIKESTAVPGSANNDANIVGNRIRNIISWDYLTDANRWFVVDQMLMKEHLLWHERVPLEFAATQDFDTFQAKYRAYMRYSRGFSDWRWVAGSEPS